MKKYFGWMFIVFTAASLSAFAQDNANDDSRATEDEKESSVAVTTPVEEVEASE